MIIAHATDKASGPCFQQIGSARYAHFHIPHLAASLAAWYSGWHLSNMKIAAGYFVVFNTEYTISRLFS